MIFESAPIRRVPFEVDDNVATDVPVGEKKTLAA